MRPFQLYYFTCGKQHHCEEFLGAYAKLQKATISLVISVRPFAHMEQLDPNWKDFREISYLIIFRKCVEKFIFLSDKLKGTLHEDLMCLNDNRSILLRMRNVSNKICKENQNTYFMFNTFFFENRAVYEIMWKNIIQPDRPYMTV